MNHINHIERTSQALSNLISNHKISLKSYEEICEGIKEKELQEYCSSAVTLRQTLIEDLKSEINAVDNRDDKVKFKVDNSEINTSKRIEAFKKTNGKNILNIIRKTEKSIVQAYMQVLRSNTFSNMTESILRGHLETLRNRLKNIKNYPAQKALRAA